MSWQCTVVIALHPFSSGDTLLAIRAPIGTQLEVPIPESVGYVSCILGSVLSSSHPCVSCITLGVTCHSDSQWTEEVPDPPEKRDWSHWGFTGQQRPIQCLPCCVASSSSRWNPPKPSNAGGNAYLSALCFPGRQVYNFYFRTDSSTPQKYWIASLQSIHTVGSCYVTPFFTFQVLKSAAAASAKLVPAAAAIQTVSSSGRNKWELQLGRHN